MGMSTHIVGYKPADEKWKKMKAIYDTCSAAKVDAPDEVDEFFEGEEPSDNGVKVRIENTKAVTEWSDDGRSGYRVDLTKLPKDVTVIEFYNSY